MDKEILLKIEDVYVHYGGVKALDGATISINEGEIIALMGPNGAGKSTILKAIFGLAPIESGKVLWPAKKDPVSSVVSVGVEDAFVKCLVGAGDYKFRASP